MTITFAQNVVSYIWTTACELESSKVSGIIRKDNVQKIYEMIRRKYCGLSRLTIQDIIINSGPIHMKTIPILKNKTKLGTLPSSEPNGRIKMGLVDAKVLAIWTY